MSKKTVVVVDPLADTSTPVALFPETSTPVPPDATEKPSPLVVSGQRPTPERELTPEQLRIRQLEDQLAREQGKKDPDVEYEAPTQPGSAANILIHFLEDGFTALGRVWYRGQELEFETGGQPYRDTFDRNGSTWLSLVDDEFGQVEKYGKVMFRRGPWPGKPLTEAASLAVARPLKAVGADTSLAAVSVAELEAAAALEAKRGRAAPRLPLR